VTTDPVEFVSKFMPEVFNAGVADLRAAAEKGDADAKKRHADLLANPAAFRVVIEGKGGADLYLVIQDGKMTSNTKAPGFDLMLALALPFDAFEVGLEELQDDIKAALPKIKKRIARMRPSEAAAITKRLQAEPLLFHQILKDTPDFEQILIKIAVGAGTPPVKPTFTVTVDYKTFEDIRTGKLKPQAIMGKLQMSGDFSRAMALGMEMMQRR